MKRFDLSIAASLILGGFTLALGAAPACAQSTAGQASAPAASTQPNPYEGVAQPPADDVITASEAVPAKPAAVPPAPAAPPTATATPAAAPKPATPSTNPDYGIVETPVPDGAGIAAATNTPRLQSRSTYNPDADIVTSVPTPDNQLPEGTPVHARIDQEISSREDGAGTAWTAQVSQDVVQNGRIIIPVGSVIHGRVTHADYGRRMYGPASLRLTPDDVTLPDGTHYVLHALVSQTARNSNTKMGREGAIQSKDHPKRLAGEYAAGGVGGAVLGGAVAGPAGAIAGSAIGVGVVTAHWLRTNHAAVLPANSEITFGLTQSLALNTTAATTTTAHN